MAGISIRAVKKFFSTTKKTPKPGTVKPAITAKKVSFGETQFIPEKALVKVRSEPSAKRIPAVSPGRQENAIKELGNFVAGYQSQLHQQAGDTATQRVAALFSSKESATAAEEALRSVVANGRKLLPEQERLTAPTAEVATRALIAYMQAALRSPGYPPVPDDAATAAAEWCKNRLLVDLHMGRTGPAADWPEFVHVDRFLSDTVFSDTVSSQRKMAFQIEMEELDATDDFIPRIHETLGTKVELKPSILQQPGALDAMLRDLKAKFSAHGTRPNTFLVCHRLKNYKVLLHPRPGTQDKDDKAQGAHALRQILAPYPQLAALVGDQVDHAAIDKITALARKQGLILDL